MVFFPYSRSRLRIWSRETGPAAPSRVSLLIHLTRAESGAYSRSSSRFPRRRPFISSTAIGSLSSSSVHATDAVHCRESARAGSVVLKVARVTGAAFSGIAMDQFLCVSLLPYPLLVQYVVYTIMCDAESVGMRKRDRTGGVRRLALLMARVRCGCCCYFY